MVLITVSYAIKDAYNGFDKSSARTNAMLGLQSIQEDSFSEALD
jgi:hypothetical protein